MGLLILERPVLGEAETIAQGTVTLGVDADPTGNTATSLGTIEPCISVSINDTFDIDIFITDVTDLLGWETYFVYDMSVANIIGRNVQMFQAANPGSNVFDASEALPDADGQYRLAAVDIAEPLAPDSGSGVLARLTLQAVGAGVSPANLALLDVNEDGTADLGPSLTDVEGDHIGDLDDDSLFDGPISSARIAVDTACPEATVTPAASPAVTATPVEAMPGAVLTPDGGAGGMLGQGGAPWAAPFIASGVLAFITGSLILFRTLGRQATFDGPISSARIAVDTACPEAMPTPPASPAAMPEVTAAPATTPTAAPVGAMPGAVVAPDGGAGGMLHQGSGPWVTPFIVGGVLAFIMGALLLSRALGRRAG